MKVKVVPVEGEFDIVTRPIKARRMVARLVTSSDVVLEVISPSKPSALVVAAPVSASAPDSMQPTPSVQQYEAQYQMRRRMASRSKKAAFLTMLAALCISIFLSARDNVLYSAGEPDVVAARPTAADDRAASPVGSVSDLLRRHTGVTPTEGPRLAQAAVQSGRKYGMDPLFIASVLLVESGANPTATSDRGAAGLLQIHVPTWGALIDRERLNVLGVEENLDFGTRVLKEYVDQYGQWNGVLHYLSRGQSREDALEKLNRIHDIYSAGAPAPVFDQGLRCIVIDAGHGGLDAGTIGRNGLTEKELVLDIAKRLRVRVESELGAHVVMTRTEDEYVPLEVRASIANAANADLFLSIHANAVKRDAVRGFEVYSLNSAPSGSRMADAEPNRNLQDTIRGIVLRDRADESESFATHIRKAFDARSQFGPDRGVKHAHFAVLTGAQMPAALAEVSFISNPDDERLLRHDERREEIAEALFEGVRSYSKSVSKLRAARSDVRTDPPEPCRRF